MIKCSKSLPLDIPESLPRFSGLYYMCAHIGEYPKNMECKCINAVNLECGRSLQVIIQLMIEYCFDGCTCAEETFKVQNVFTRQIPRRSGIAFGGVTIRPPTSRSSQHGRTSSPQINTPVYTCSKASCMNINDNCSGSRRGAECRYYAAHSTFNYYFTGGCSRGRIELKHDLLQQRHSYYHNLTTQYASVKSGNVTVPSLFSQFASDLLPSPCNASYVSFACRDSVDGIVHEPKEN